MTLRRGLSINRKLPLLITGLLLAVIAAGTWATYREVRRTALDSSMSRLQRAAEQLAGILDQSVANRMTRIGGIGSNPGVQQALAGGPTPSVVLGVTVAEEPAETRPWSLRAWVAPSATA